MTIHRLLFTVLAVVAIGVRGADAQTRPNVILIYTDDLGYGDVSSYGATAVKTPNIDRLAKEGLRFTDAHAPAATCTPSRYALLTGEYAWRRPETGILPGNAALIIEPGRTTLPSVLQKAGYATAVVGKWHLGLGPSGGPDWNGGINPSPNDVGFDYSFVMAATGDRVPTVFIENRGVVGLDAADPISVSYGNPVGDWPTGKANQELLKMHPSHGHDQTIVNGISRIGYMTGGRSALWKDEDMADVFTRRAIGFIEAQKAKPFFLYFALHDPHVPRVPHPRFVGSTTLGPRGDAIVQADGCVGEVLAALDRLNLTRNTLVIFTSDNGPVVDDGYKDEAVARLGSHKPAGPYRGGKYSTFEGGTRVPFIVRWPGRVTPGRSDALVSQVDFVASFAAFTGQTLAAGDAPDSVAMMPVLLGRSKTGRSDLVEQAGGLALRREQWKYIAPTDGPKVNVDTNTELGNDKAPQLYDLGSDPGETLNVASRYPARVKQMEALLQEIRHRRASGTSPTTAAGAPAAGAAVVQSEFIFETVPFASAHASTIVDTTDGLVAAWFGGTREGAPDVGIWLSRRMGDGWSQPVEVATGAQADGTRHPCWNPVLFELPDRTLLLFYKVGPTPQSWWGMLRTSSDSGRTWSDARRLPDGILGPIKNRPVRLADGALLAPSSTESPDRPSSWRVHFERTADGARTWTSTSPAPSAAGSEIDAIQPSVLVHPGGRLQAVGRTRSGRLFDTWSSDGGRTWTPLALMALPNPDSGIDAITLRDGRHLIVYNHTGQGRSPLNVSVSRDGKSWEAALVLEREPGEYSYPAVIQGANGLVHITYTWKRQRIKHVVIDPKRLTAAAMPDGQWPAAVR